MLAVIPTIAAMYLSYGGIKNFLQRRRGLAADVIHAEIRRRLRYVHSSPDFAHRVFFSQLNFEVSLSHHNREVERILNVFDRSTGAEGTEDQMVVSSLYADRSFMLSSGMGPSGGPAPGTAGVMFSPGAGGKSPLVGGGFWATGPSGLPAKSQGMLLIELHALRQVAQRLPLRVLALFLEDLREVEDGGLQLRQRRATVERMHRTYGFLRP
jgi:hypothetical protein